MAFIVPMHQNKPNVIYLLTRDDAGSIIDRNEFENNSAATNMIWNMLLQVWREALTKIDLMMTQTNPTKVSAFDSPFSKRTSTPRSGKQGAPKFHTADFH